VYVFHTVFDQCWSVIQCVHLDNVRHSSNSMGPHSHSQIEEIEVDVLMQKIVYCVAILYVNIEYTLVKS
jgi:predicted metal-binding protein